MSEREKFSAFLFGREDIEVLDVKFMRGTSPTLTSEEMCATAREALQQFFGGDRTINVLPDGRRAQREVADALASY